MRIAPRRHFTARVALALALVAVGSATAQTLPGAATRGAAYEEFQAGLAAANVGRWSEALDHFSRSYVLEPRSGTLLNLAGAQVETGHLVEGIDSYRRLLREASDWLTPSQRRAATDAIAATEALLPHVRLAVHSLADRDVLAIDADALPAAALAAPVPVDPGDHVLTVTRDAHEIARATFHAELRETRDVTVELPPRVIASAAPTSSAPPSSAPPSSASPTIAQRVLAPHPQEAPRRLVSRPAFWTMAAVFTLAIAGGVVAFVYFTTPRPYPGDVPPGVLRGP